MVQLEKPNLEVIPFVKFLDIESENTQGSYQQGPHTINQIKDCIDCFKVLYPDIYSYLSWIILKGIKH